MKKGFLLAMAAVFALGGAGLTACKEEETIPLEKAGESTTLVTDKSPTELDAYSVAYAFMLKQSELTSYEIKTTGTTTAKTIVAYTQQIENTEIKHGDEYYQAAKSSSALVTMTHQSMTKGDKVAYRNAASGEISAATKEDYKAIYGITPDEIGLGGYIVNKSTLRYAEKVEGEALTYRYVLDGETAGINAKKQMKEFGSLKSYPVFSSLELLLTIEDDWTPVSLVTKATYDIEIAVLGETSCTQEITATWSKVNGNVSVPDSEAFNAAIGSTPSEVKPGEAERSPLMSLAEAFENAYEKNKGISLDLGVTAMYGETALSVSGELTAKYYPAALEDGNLLDFLALSFSVPLTLPESLSIPADTLCVRYLGDGELLFYLYSSETGNRLFSYSSNVSEALSVGGEMSAEEIVELLTKYAEVTETDTGYELSVKPAALLLFNIAYDSFLSGASDTLDEINSYLVPLLDVDFTSLSVDVTVSGGAVTDAEIVIETVPVGEIESTSATYGVEISSEWLEVGADGLLAAPLTGKLNVTYDPSKIISGDLSGAVNFRLDADLSGASPIISLIAFAGMMMPDLAGLAVYGSMEAVTIYYIGDGVLYVALSDADGNVFELAQIDFAETAQIVFPVLALLTGSVDENDLVMIFEAIGSTGLFTATESTDAETGALTTTYALSEDGVGLLAAGYSEMIAGLKDSLAGSLGEMAEFVGQLIDALLGVTINGLQIETETAGGSLTEIALNIDCFGSGSYSEQTFSFLRLGVSFDETEEGALNGDAEKVKELLADATAAAAVNDAIAQAQENLYIDANDGYLADLAALRSAYEALTDAQKSLVTNYSGIAVQEEIYRHLKQNADAFLAYFDGNSLKSDMTDSDWTAINELYDEGGSFYDDGWNLRQYDAIKDSEASLAYIGSAKIEAYLAARAAYGQN